MSVQDLTNTTWVFNNSLTRPTGGEALVFSSINFTSNHYNFITLGFPPTAFSDTMYYDGNESITVYNFAGSWTDEAYKTITFTGGTDATNATLIAWLEANGTLTAPQTPQITVDMSSLSGWSNVSAGSHTLTIKAKATGYRDSALSTGVSFTKMQQLDTPYIELGE